MGETITLQRRSTKITLSLSLFGEYDAFRKHVRDSFKLGDEVKKATEIKCSKILQRTHLKSIFRAWGDWPEL